MDGSGDRRKGGHRKEGRLRMDNFFNDDYSFIAYGNIREKDDLGKKGRYRVRHFIDFNNGREDGNFQKRG